MRVLVTGSGGKIGREAVLALKGAGHRLVGLDLRASTEGGVRTVACDCTDFGAVISAVSGVDTLPGPPEAIVHLAGIPAPGLAVDHMTFDANLRSTYNVFSAAARLGVPRVVWGSSETILGLPFDRPPAYAPLDEHHPDRPEWSYALSKFLGEQMADQMVRWQEKLSIVSLRFSNVYEARDYAQREAIEAKPALRKLNLWSYVDVRDAGEACRLAVESEISGHERMIIAAGDTLVTTPSAELMQSYFPETIINTPLEGCVSLLSSEKARAVIGYEPRHSWRAA